MISSQKLKFYTIFKHQPQSLNQNKEKYYFCKSKTKRNLYSKHKKASSIMKEKRVTFEQLDSSTVKINFPLTTNINIQKELKNHSFKEIVGRNDFVVINPISYPEGSLDSRNKLVEPTEIKKNITTLISTIKDTESQPLMITLPMVDFHKVERRQKSSTNSSPMFLSDWHIAEESNSEIFNLNNSLRQIAETTNTTLIEVNKALDTSMCFISQDNSLETSAEGNKQINDFILSHVRGLSNIEI